MTGIWDEGYRSYLGISADKLAAVRESAKAATDVRKKKWYTGMSRSQQKPY
jgi:hypothetical protein